MAFSEPVKLEAKKRAHYQCVTCRQIVFVEVHHIMPQSEGGPDTIENAAPLCPSCHEIHGGNPNKRKWLREARDFWWELCEKKVLNPAIVELNNKVDAYRAEQKSNHASYSKALEGIKEALIDYHGRSGYEIEHATDFSGLSNATGISLPASLPVTFFDECPQCHGPTSLVREKSDGERSTRWYRCDRCSHDLPPVYAFVISDPGKSR
jgi:hypothetical protein